MLFHGIDKGDDHRLSLSFSDLSVWCYACDSYVDNPVRVLTAKLILGCVILPLYDEAS